MTQTNLLDKPATIGDIIAWNMGIAAVLLAVTVCPLGPGYIANFQRMFDALGGKLPSITILYINYGKLIFYTTSLATLGAVFYALILEKDQIRKVTICLASIVCVALVISLGIAAIFYPILELQSAIRAGG